MVARVRKCHPARGVRRDVYLTVPNLLCAVRLLGSCVLVGAALARRDTLFVGLFLFLAATDWMDGKLAVLLKQRTAFGARLDSWADAFLYGALLVGSLWLQWDTLRHEMVWIVPAVASYALSVTAGLAKFGVWPSYHTRSAKISWFLVTGGALSVLLQWSVIPLRIAMAAVVLTNIESTAITTISDEWRADVSSVLEPIRIARTESGGARPGRMRGVRR